MKKYQQGDVVMFQVDEENATNFDYGNYRNEVKQDFIYTGRML